MLQPEIISNDDKKIQKIFHLSDIHIRLEDNRHSEYRRVFVRTYNKIKKLKEDEEALIVITGDILHSKTNLKPECIDLVKDLFIRLAKLSDIIVILGNHDCNLNNKDSMDSLKPIITKGFKTKYKIHLLNDDMVYQYNNVLFGVTTMYSNGVTPCKIKTDKVKIGLYHGFVAGAYTDLGYSVREKKGIYDIKDFKDYDLVMLGDVHKFQYLDKKKRIAYASSLIQQNHGENRDHHGFIMWDLETLKSKFFNVMNDYGYVSFKLSKKGLYDVPKKLPSILRLKLLYDSDVGRVQLQDMEKKLKDDYEIDEFTVTRITNDDQINIKMKDKNNKSLKINNNNNVLKIISSYIERNMEEIDEEEKKKIMKQADIILKQIDFDYENAIKNISLLDIHFDNMFAYGEDNHINFERMEGIVGLVAPNHYGKSCLIDTILHGLFGKSSRGQKNDCLNINKDTLKVKVDIKVDDDKYTIRRSGEKSGKRKTIAESVDLYKNDGIATRDDKKQTDNYINNVMCEKDDLTKMNILLQNDAEFVKMSDTERRELLFKFFKLDIFSAISKIAKSEYSMRIRSISDLKKEMNKYDEDDLKVNLQTDENNIEKLELRIKDLEKDISNLTKKLGEYENKLGNVDNSDVKDLVKEAKKLNKELDELNITLKSKNKTVVILEKKVPNLKQKMFECKERMKDYEDIDKEKDEFDKKKKKELRKLQEEINYLHKQIKEVDNDIDWDKISEKLIKTRKLQNTIKSAIKDIQIDISKNKKKIKTIKITKKVKDNAKKYESELQELELLKEKLEENTKKLSLTIEGLEKLRNHEYNPECEACMKNPLTEQKVLYEKDIEKLNKDIKSQKTQIKKLNKKISLLKEDYETLKKVEKYTEQNKELEEENSKLEEQLTIKEEKLMFINEKVNENEKKLEQKKKLEKTVEANEYFEKKIIHLKKKLEEAEEKQFNKYNRYMFDKEEYEENKMKYNEKENKLLRLQNEKQDIEIKTKNLNDEVNKVNKKVSKYNESKNLIETLNNTKDELEEKQNEKEESLLKIKTYQNNITNNKTSLSKLNDAQVKDRVMVEEKELYKRIADIVGGQGLINDIFTDKIIPRLESYVNDILGSVTDFLISMEYSNNSIHIYKVIGSKRVNLSLMSGYEKFVVNVAFRMALSELNNNIKANFFIIDEGFSYCDKNHLTKLKSLFEYLRKRFKWSLIISHLDEIKENFDQTLNIDIIDGYSRVKLD